MNKDVEALSFQQGVEGVVVDGYLGLVVPKVHESTAEIDDLWSGIETGIQAEFVDRGRNLRRKVCRKYFTFEGADYPHLKDFNLLVGKWRWGYSKHCGVVILRPSRVVDLVFIF
ncbi:hypothetical protein BZY94_03070 [Burkholderia territorii]|nr:hypothetical protein BZY94_03070 [Burkholderia territorii]